METVKDIFVVILLASGSFLCLALIFYIGRITKSIESIQSELRGVSSQLTPLLESLTTLSRSVKILSEELRDQVAKTAWVFDEIKSKVEGLLTIEKRVREVVESPAQNLMSMLGYVREKVSGFFTRR